MAKSPISELFSTFKSYAQKLSDGERTPTEIASALNDWARESADSVRAKIQEEVETAVLRMGFVKREEFDALAKEVAALKKAPTTKSRLKKTAEKPVSRKIVQVSPNKKSPNKKSPTKKAAR